VDGYISSKRDHIAKKLLNGYKLAAVGQADRLTSVGINSGGSGYIVGNIIPATGGTGIGVAARVSSVKNGSIATFTISAAGADYVEEENLTVTGGSGSGATFTIDTVGVTGDITAATVTSGGSGYIVGNILTGVGGSGSGATFTVSSVSDGVITGLEIISGGTNCNGSETLDTTGIGNEDATFALSFDYGNRVIDEYIASI
jgi:hypothetical protein